MKHFSKLLLFFSLSFSLFASTAEAKDSPGSVFYCLRRYVLLGYAPGSTSAQEEYRTYCVNSKGELQFSTDIELPPMLLFGDSSVVPVHLDKGYFLLNRKGDRKAIENMKEVKPFKYGLALFQRGGKYGYINEQGKIVIEPMFDRAFDFSADRIARVKIGKGYRFINTSGKFINDDSFSDAGDFGSGLASVRIDKKYGFINTKGNLVISPDYPMVGSFEGGFARVRLPNNQWNFVNPKGDFLLKEPARMVRNFSKDGVAPVRSTETGKWGYVNKSGEFIVKPLFPYVSDMMNDGFYIAGRKGDYFLYRLKTKYKQPISDGNLYSDVVGDRLISKKSYAAPYFVGSDSLEKDNTELNGIYYPFDPFYERESLFIDKKSGGAYLLRRVANKNGSLGVSVVSSTTEDCDFDRVVDANGKVYGAQLGNPCEVRSLMQEEKRRRDEIACQGILPGQVYSLNALTFGKRYMYRVVSVGGGSVYLELEETIYSEYSSSVRYHRGERTSVSCDSVKSGY